MTSSARNIANLKTQAIEARDTGARRPRPALASEDAHPAPSPIQQMHALLEVELGSAAFNPADRWSARRSAVVIVGASLALWTALAIVARVSLAALGL